MASEERPPGAQEVSDAATRERPWQFSLRSLLALTALLAMLFSLSRLTGELGFWFVMVIAAIVVAIAARRHPSTIIRLLASLMAFQFVGAALLQPGDGNVWFCRICRLYLAVDVFLFARLYVFYRMARKPEPQLSWLVKIAILTSPVWMAVIATHLMETYHVFR
jgi:hypothetical protein